ncbi:aldo/keto reductase, putative [Talaromyces stipitatus ATCC 10500]|uniref:Aldo/keto reductase, putative n=1 Tax=Talaromyces stipitatus (strain ATCC 10500 / CBS 375.48 / QM 6759 / NRRL 1006) TaxID=441959 RepID=B8LU99_TALSN|nr:aldo/keto reductase, putative [Talaromyces stipitatus ATCC 10500]EED22571.1 aldo/keto reductase, putative [Talaromyces stipitatus ATCC 10500]
MSVTLVNKQVGQIGFGLMGLTWRPNPAPYEEAAKVMKHALEKGANFWNGAQFYGPPHANSLQLLEYYFTQYPEDADKVVLSIKGGMTPQGPNGTREGIQASVDKCLEVLKGKVKISIFEPARVDPNVPIETTVEALAEYVKAGKIGAIGLSECSAATIERAHAVHPIATAEIELSLFSTDPLTNGIAETCGKLGIPLVAYSPLSRGFLTGQVRSPSDIPEGDLRAHYPRFQPDVFPLNLKLVEELEQIAKKKSVTLPQVAIAWVREQSRTPGMPVILPIPGCTTVARVDENLTSVPLDDDDLKQIGSILDQFPVHGARYGGHIAKYMSG